MFRKLFIVCLLIMVAAFFAVPAFSAATKARVGAMDKGVLTVSGIADLSSGDTLEVDNSGRAYVRSMGGHTISSQWGDGLVYTGACVVWKVYVQGQTADDFAAIYDGISVGADAKLDPQAAVAKESKHVDVGGAAFATGIYVDAADADVLVTIVYDTLP